MTKKKEILIRITAIIGIGLVLGAIFIGIVALFSYSLSYTIPPVGKILSFMIALAMTGAIITFFCSIVND